MRTIVENYKYTLEIIQIHLKAHNYEHSPVEMPICPCLVVAPYTIFMQVPEIVLIFIIKIKFITVKYSGDVSYSFLAFIILYF